MRNKILRKLLALTLVILFTSTFFALTYIPPPPGGKKQLRKSATYDYDTWLDINEMRVNSSNDGGWGFNQVRGDWGIEFPKGSGRFMNWSAGVWIAGIPEGGTVEADLRNTVFLWGGEWVPGPMANRTFIPDNSDFKMYKLTKGVSGPGDPDWEHWKSVGSNFSQYGCIGPYAPLITDPTDELVTEYGYSVGDPYITGDQCLWGVWNDANPDTHTSGNGQSTPLDIEVKETVWGYDKSGALGKTVFTRFEFTNKGNTNLRDMYFSFWADCDQGDSFNDLCGCDPDKSMGYVYDGTTDAVYFDYGVAGGYDFFQGPIGRDGETLPMTSFAHYINGTDPRGKFEAYNYMRGLNPKDGSPVVNPVTGQVTKFLITGDPVTNTGWLDVNPGDRRLMLNSGPFDMDPGDTNEVVFAFIVGVGPDRLSAISGLRYNDIFAQGAFDIGFEVPPDPPAPELTIVTTPDEIFMSWDDNAEDFSVAGYEFEGYNIYITNNPSPTGDSDWKLVHTFDKVNGVQTILGVTLDINTGLLLEQPIQFGKDTGLKRFLKITTDEWAGGTTPLTAEKTYYYAVTSYAYNPIGAPKALETPKKLIEIVPQKGTPGTDLTKVEDATGIDVTHTAGIGKGEITVHVADPSAVTGENYKVTISEKADGTLAWNLLRGSTAVLQNNTNFTGDWNYPVVDGLVVRFDGLVTAPSTGTIESFPASGDELNWSPKLANYGRDYAGGGSEISDAMLGHDLEVRFTSSGSKASMIGGWGDWDASSSTIVDVPFEIWDVQEDPPVQVNAAFYDRNGSGDFTLHRNYIAVIMTPYDPNTAYGWTDPMVGWSLRLDNGEGYDATGDVVRYTFDDPLAAGVDEFTFSTVAPKIDDPELAKQEFKNDIRAVPNPYYGFSLYEMNRFERVIKFINLPKKCTIRIFDLLGTLLRTIEKDDNSSVYDWNIKTDFDLPLASGVYIYHIDSPDLGSTIGKVVIFAEMETLKTY